MKPNTVSSKRSNKTDKPLASRTKKKIQIANIGNESEDITTNSTRIRTIREYYEQLYANELYNLDEMDTFLETKASNSKSQRNRKSK